MLISIFFERRGTDLNLSFCDHLAKIELICQQPAMPQPSGVQGVASQPWGAGEDGCGSWGGLALWCICLHYTEDYLAPDICSLIKLTAIEKIM